MRKNKCHVFCFCGLIHKMPPILQVPKSHQKLIIDNPNIGGILYFCDLVAKTDFSKTQGLNIEIRQ